MEYRRIVLFLSLALGVGACSPYNSLFTDFVKKRNSIQYLYTSKKVTGKKDITVSVAKTVIKDPNFKSGGVLKIKGEVAPLLFINTWKYQFECVVGRNQIKEDLNSFIQTSLVNECNRSGHFKADTASGNHYTLEIEVDSLQSKGQLYNSGHFVYLVFFYSYHKIEKLGEARAYSRFHYRLKKGDQLITDSYVSSTSSLELLKPAKITFSQLHEYYRANLVESLSETLKKNIEQVVRVANRKIDEDNP
jgi:hypothetical protein